MKETHQIAVIIPAYNEEQTIAATIKDFYSVVPDAFFCIVDNNSTDRTSEVVVQVLDELGIKGALYRELTQGKAAAVRKGFHMVDADIYVMVDADCTYPAKDLTRLLKPVLAETADMVVGNRRSMGRYDKENKRLFHSWGNKLVQRLINLCFNSRLEDILSGYRVMSRRFVKNYPIIASGFMLETEMTIHALDKGFSVLELPTEYRDRPEGSFSKLNTIRDGFRIISLIIDIFRLYRPMFFFSLLCVFFLLLSLSSGMVPVLEFIRTGYITHVPLVVLAGCSMIIALGAMVSGIVLSGIAYNLRFQYQVMLNHYSDKR